MTKSPTPLERAILACGTQQELARRIGRSQQIVSYWRKAKIVPAEVAGAIEEACEGAVKRHELRPDLFEASA
jgi:DNA-binding transcriptional regulator YdaS (Cro superfamily)